MYAITQANADASAGTININHDGTPIAGTPAPDIARGFSGIPRSAQPRLTASQQRILECTHRVAEANADMPYALFVPSTYDPQKPAPLVVDLHGLNITPLQQILFDGTTDFAERYGFIVLAPMGFNLSSWWGSRTGKPVATAAVKPGGDVRTPIRNWRKSTPCSKMLMIWQLLQVRHVHDVPLILVGKMWRGLVDWAKTSMLDPRLALASAGDLQIPQCLDTADEAIAVVRDLHGKWAAGR